MCVCSVAWHSFIALALISDVNINLTPPLPSFPQHTCASNGRRMTQPLLPLSARPPVRFQVMGIGPAYAIPAALNKVGLTVNDIDVFEINEAFASQAVYCVKKLGVPAEKLNPNGGAYVFKRWIYVCVC